MEQQLLKSSSQEVSTMLQTVIDDIEQFADTAPQHDDMTVLMMHYHPQEMEIPNPFKVHFTNDISEIASCIWWLNGMRIPISYLKLWR